MYSGSCTVILINSPLTMISGLRSCYLGVLITVPTHEPAGSCALYMFNKAINVSTRTTPTTMGTAVKALMLIPIYNSLYRLSFLFLNDFILTNVFLVDCGYTLNN
ncbi:hypothetical protein VMUT_2015 [Vulcanisaeta moutnovskia 768-28]|uniref:Uncharacterized protein n=1 Tax=Vulcanisaeta moutnovskia (strain 768-28) TaxID=985053 RepID=F0QWB9_VULM7|nr:hypothetical protein [Vulcanisaeta moutnovskia]ADY02214.1 hypothetical protein VMUT_2015 [Vulcanisaeta moutnovskia 768-28]